MIWKLPYNNENTGDLTLKANEVIRQQIKQIYAVVRFSSGTLANYGYGNKPYLYLKGQMGGSRGHKLLTSQPIVWL